MRTNEIKVGGRYVAKVGGRLTVVRVEAEYEYQVGHPGGQYRSRTLAWRTGWIVRNERTGRALRMPSPQRFRQEAVA